MNRSKLTIGYKLNDGSIVWEKPKAARKPFKAVSEVATLQFNMETLTQTLSKPVRIGDQLTAENGKPANGNYTLSDGRIVIAKNGIISFLGSPKELSKKGINI
jgi:hypothetical protein